VNPITDTLIAKQISNEYNVFNIFYELDGFVLGLSPISIEKTQRKS
jgi:hypothetical protein